MTHEVRRAHAEARPTAVLAATTTWADFPALWRPLLDEVHASVTWPDGHRPGRNVMLYLDDVPHVEVGVELDVPATLSGRVARSALPAGDVASVVHHGDYAGLGAAHDAVQRWCADAGLVLAGPRWEIYGHWDPADPVTEVCYLLS